MKKYYPITAMTLILTLIVSYFLSNKIDGALFSFHLIMIFVVVYCEGKKPAYFLTLFSIFKIVILDLNSNLVFKAVSFDDLLRLILFTTGSVIIIFVVDKLKLALIKNQELLTLANSAVMAKQEMMGIVSHDLKNPLGAIMMNAEIIKRYATKNNIEEKIISRCNGILNSSETMQILIEDLLELTKLEGGNLQLTKTSFPLSELLERLKEQMAAGLDKKNIGLHIINDKNPVIKADFQKILRVFSNLLGNAIKFSPEDSSIKIEIKYLRNELIAEIKDQGPGIAQEHLDNIFEKFWQSGLQSSKGAGLGLSIAKNIIKAHQGKIWVESTLGKGSSFYFSIPLD